jgi:hypothetical protein
LIDALNEYQNEEENRSDTTEVDENSELVVEKEKNQSSSSIKEPVSSEEEEEEKIVRYEEMSLKEIKEKCKECGIKIGKKKKQELIDALNEHQNEEEGEENRSDTPEVNQEKKEENLEVEKKKESKQLCGYCLQTIPGPDHTECVLRVGGVEWEKAIRQIEETDEEEDDDDLPIGKNYDMYLFSDEEEEQTSSLEKKKNKYGSKFLSLLEEV